MHLYISLNHDLIYSYKAAYQKDWPYHPPLSTFSFHLAVYPPPLCVSFLERHTKTCRVTWSYDAFTLSARYPFIIYLPLECSTSLTSVERIHSRKAPFTHPSIQVFLPNSLLPVCHPACTHPFLISGRSGAIVFSKCFAHSSLKNLYITYTILTPTQLLG